MQYRLSTLFLVFFVVATTMALFGEIGLWLSPVILLLAFGINHIKRQVTLMELLVLLAITGTLVGLLQPVRSRSRESHRIRQCADNVKKIGEAFQRYHAAHGHFPMATIKDANGKALRSWRVEILPGLGYGSLYDQLQKDEPWDSPHNLGLLNQQIITNDGCSIPEYFCPNDRGKNTANYRAIIGPGTAWNEGKPTELSELPDGGKHTVLILEMLNTGKHWGEPEDITVENLLEQLKTNPRETRFSNHPAGSHVLLADGSVWRVPQEMPLSLWQRLLGGEIKTIDDLNVELAKTNSGSAFVSYNAAEKSSFFKFESNVTSLNLYAIPVWLLSIILLFRRAIKSRKPAEIVKMENFASPPG
jgi:hypothetical protein